MTSTVDGTIVLDDETLPLNEHGRICSCTIQSAEKDKSINKYILVKVTQRKGIKYDKAK